MCKTKTMLIIALLLMSSVLFIQKTEASIGQAKVYIICLSDIPTADSWVDDPQRVKDGAIDACMLKGKYIEGNIPIAHPKRDVDYPAYYEAIPCVVTSWSQYASIIEGLSEVIVVNTHGQYLPIPSGYTKEQWVDKIAYAMLNRRLTWVHVGGYTFFRVWYQQTGTGEQWGEQGFKHFMSNINKSNVDCWPPSPINETENELATFSMSGSQQLGLSWFFNQSSTIKGPITEFHYATLGRPLKLDDFKEYLILPLFKYQGYWAGAVIAFAKAGARYTTEHGIGTYVHIGARYLYDIDGIQFDDADFGRGFIGTAAALWVESMGFNPSYGSREGGSYEDKLRAFIKVYPSVSGVTGVGSNVRVRLEFPISEMTQGYNPDYPVFIMDARFYIWELPPPWNNTQMMVDLGYSREASGESLQIEGLYDEDQSALGLVTEGLSWYVGGLMAYGCPIIGDILFGAGGFKLLGQWLGQSCSQQYSGINNWASWIGFGYTLQHHVEIIESKPYVQYGSIITVDLNILPTWPNGTYRSGWQIIPIEYEVEAYTSELGWLNANDTLELAVWFEGGGQSDAGSGGDATYSDPVSVTFPETYHGYLGSSDNEDWYTFTVEPLKSISINMTPPPFVNFDLELYRPNGTLKAESHQGAGVPDIIQCGTESGGTWKLKICKVQGSGVYSLNFEWIYSLTVKTRKTGGEFSGVNVWIDGSPVSPSPVTVAVSAGTHAVQVESDFSRYSFHYTFSHWEDNSTNNPRTIIVSENMIVTAYYNVEYEGTCPTLFVWNGTDYTYESLLDIHAESDVTLQHRITQPLVKDGVFYKLSLRELDEFTSHIDQVRLYAVDSSGEQHICLFASAIHSDQGRVTFKLRFDDDIRVDITPTETIDLKFTYCGDDISYFIFEINGHNKKWPG